MFSWLSTTTNYTKSIWCVRCRLAEPGRDAPYGVGAVRVHTWLIGWFRESITAYDAPRSFDYHVDAAVPPADHELGRMTFTETAAGTHVVWTTRVRVRLPVVGGVVTRFLAGPVIRLVFARILAAAEADL